MRSFTRHRVACRPKAGCPIYSASTQDMAAIAWLPQGEQPGREDSARKFPWCQFPWCWDKGKGERVYLAHNSRLQFITGIIKVVGMQATGLPQNHVKSRKQ